MFFHRQKIIDKINHFSGQNTPFLFAVDFNGEKGFVYTPEEAENKGLQYFIRGIQNDPESIKKRPVSFGFIPIDFQSYKSAFNKVIFHLKRGDTYLLNLTFPTPLQTTHSLQEIYEMSSAPFKLLVPGHFVVFSPETFVNIQNAKISSHPMKGTIDASVPDAEQTLLADKKEFYEHNTIVDLIRNDLSMVATDVRVDRFRYIGRIITNRGDLLQMSSEISGNLPDGYLKHLGDILFRLLPAGSVTGAPKEKTVSIIREVEDCERGFYTGIFGYFDGNSLFSAVSIRFVEQAGEGLVFKSGGGITALSDAESEYREMIKKIYIPVT